MSGVAIVACFIGFVVLMGVTVEAEPLIRYSVRTLASLLLCTGWVLVAMRIKEWRNHGQQ